MISAIADPGHADSFHRDGFVVINEVSEYVLADLERVLKTNANLPSTDFYYSLLEHDYAENIEIRDAIRSALQPLYKQLFINFKTVTESYMIKPANVQSEMLLHQDWSFTDETRFLPVTLWIPMADVTPQNGAMFFLKGSHLWFRNLRSGSLPTIRVPSTSFRSEDICSVPVKRGQVLLFSPATFHGSYPNHSDVSRAVISATVLPNQTDYLYFHKGPDDTVQQFILDENAFLRELKTIVHGSPPALPMQRTFTYRSPEINLEVLLTYA